MMAEYPSTPPHEDEEGGGDMDGPLVDCPPPSVVFALGKSEEAAVWWLIEDEAVLADITAWQVLRYRRDRTNEWRYKGMVETPSSAVTLAAIMGLSNGFEVTS